MRISRRAGAAVVAAFVAGSMAVAVPTDARGPAAPRAGADGFSAVDAGITEVGRDQAAKSVTGKLAESDPALLDRADATPVNVMVKLDYDAAANYEGDIEGLAPTSPRVTGTKLSGKSAAEKSYAKYTGSIDGQFRAAAAKIPGARLGQSLTTVYGGVAMQVPANQVSALLALPNVTAVQSDTLNQLQTDSSTTFIGAPTIWNQQGGQALGGKGVIFADIDSGVWPEHPSLADNPALGNPPPALTGQPRACNFGDNPLTPAVDVFTCNHKLIGGQPFLATYNAVVGGEIYPSSARDSNGHGTHTTTTAAGGIVDSAKIFGVDRGRISGVAPGAWVLSYKVCGVEGCFSSDSVAAVQQAILDGADVINFSISGGANPFTDPVELAFLGAYQAGITVAASAGNSGPGAGTTDHRSPWVITVAASTQARAFQSTLTLTSGTDSRTLVGSSITAGAGPAEVVMAENIPGYSSLCATPLPAGSATGKIVACERGGTVDGVAIGRVQKGYNVEQGGAAGMILYNPTLADTETDNHFLPAVHLADGTAFKDFMSNPAHATVTATFTGGVKATEQGDVMAAFSSRGPGGTFLKPDITAPGVQILAGNTPTPDEIASGPAGEYFQAIAGTSMSSPHIAGSAILLQSLHPTWSPGAIKSALMTTATTNVVKEDTTTPADPFDFGAGRVDLTVAGAAPVVFEDSAQNMLETGNDPLLAMNVNIPSVNLPTMPGSVTVTRTATNVTKKAYNFQVTTDAPDGATIKVTPKNGKIKAGESKTFTITVTSSAPAGQYFGQIDLISAGNPTLHLPVAFDNQQGDVTLQQSCARQPIRQRTTTVCTVTATNQSFQDANVAAVTKVSSELLVTDTENADMDDRGKTVTPEPVTLAGKQDAIPAIAPGDTPAGGYLPLSAFGGTITATLTDEQSVNYDVPAFNFGGQTYEKIGIVSNGYVVVGGTNGSADIEFEPQTLPDPARPNNVLAPYWTDLDQVTTKINVLTDGVDNWIVAETSGRIWGSGANGIPLLTKTMQVWIRTGTVEDISYAYDAPTLASTNTNGQDVTTGAENGSGTAGAQISGLPTGSYVVSSTPGEPGESLTYTLTVFGNKAGPGTLTTTMVSDIVAGITVVQTPLEVVPR